MNGKTNASDVTINQIVNGVLIPLEPATNFKIGSGSGRAYFTWTDPVDKYTTPGDELVSQWEKSVVVRKKDSAPSNIDDGTVVLTETVRNQYQTSQYVDESVEDDTTYYYSVYPVTTTGLTSDSVGGVAVIPMGGEPGFKTYLEDIFTATQNSNDSTYIAGAANKSSLIITEMNYGYRDDSLKRHALDLDLTYHLLEVFTKEGRQRDALGEMDEYVIMTEGYGTGGSDGTNRAAYTYAYDTDLTKTSLSPALLAGLGFSVTPTNRSCVMFAGGTGYQAYGTNRAEVINNDLTIQDIGPMKDTDHYGPYNLCGTYIGNYYIYGFGEDNDDNYYYINRTMYVWDDDYTKISGVHEASDNYWHDGYAYQVDEYALFWSGGYDADIYFETWDSSLTFSPYTQYSGMIDTLRLEHTVDSATLRSYRCRSIVNRQYGNYAIMPSGSDMDEKGTNMVMFNSDLSAKVEYLNDYMAGAGSMNNTFFAIFDKMYIFANCGYRTGEVSLFVLTI